MGKYLVLLCAVVGLAGCATVGVTTLKAAAPKPESCKIEVYASESEVKKPFETVCILDAKTGASSFEDRSLAGALKLLGPKACGCGADALVIMSGEGGATHVVTGNGQGAATAKAIRFTVQ